MCIDLSQLSQHVGGLEDEERKALIAQLRSALIQKSQEVRAAVAADDWVQLRQLTHNLKSNTRYYGAFELQKLCMQGEKLTGLAPVPASSVRQWIIRFNQACDEVIIALSQSSE